MKKLIATTSLLAALLTMTACDQVEVSTVPTETVTPSVTQTQTCEEDMPCWDCKIHGNKICGPVVTVAEIPTQTPTEVPVELPIEVPIEVPVVEEIVPQDDGILSQEEIRIDAINTMMDGNPYDENTISDFDSVFSSTQMGEPTLGEDYEAFESLVYPNMWHIFKLA